MKTFVVAWINFFDNNLHQRIVAGEDIVETARKEFLDVVYNGGASDDSLEAINEMSLEELYDEAFNCDGGFSIIEVPK